MSPAATVLQTAVTFVGDDGVERYGYAAIELHDAGVLIPTLGRAGLRASGSNSVTFSDVDVPPSALRGRAVLARRTPTPTWTATWSPRPRLSHADARSAACGAIAARGERGRAGAHARGPSTRDRGRRLPGDAGAGRDARGRVDAAPWRPFSPRCRRAKAFVQRGRRADRRPARLEACRAAPATSPAARIASGVAGTCRVRPGFMQPLDRQPRLRPAAETCALGHGNALALDDGRD